MEDSYSKVKVEHYENALMAFRLGNLKLYTNISSDTFGEILEVSDVKRYMYRLYVKNYIDPIK